MTQSSQEDEISHRLLTDGASDQGVLGDVAELPEVLAGLEVGRGSDGVGQAGHSDQELLQPGLVQRLQEPLSLPDRWDVLDHCLLDL